MQDALKAFKLLFLEKPSILKKLLLLFSLLLHLHSYAQNSYWQQKVDMDIDVNLNDTANTLTGNITMLYQNNSPDTLHTIWIHLWPNAYKNDRTAFSDQLLENGRTDFYFSKEEFRGYINRLNFTVNNEIAEIKDHPQHQDIIQLILAQPAAPGSVITIQTPFNIKIPHVFSRSGYLGKSFQLTQWFPKPAVYDKKGWHPVPYLDQGEFYSEFGDYSVSITLPESYKVAATGKQVSKNITDTMQTVVYKQSNVHDFAWFASKDYILMHDTLLLPSKKIIDINIYHFEKSEKLWVNGIENIKQAIKTKSEWIGEYPYPVVSVVEQPSGSGVSYGGMEYPTITILSANENAKSLDFLINHEVGHNWFQGILATNERLHPWMDEGMNSYYDKRYGIYKYQREGVDVIGTSSGFVKKREPDDFMATLLSTVIKARKDQPIETGSEQFSQLNYNLIAYEKTAQWMQLLEKELGTNLFDSVMRNYYQRWQFKHPYPEDFKQTAEEVSGKDLSPIFSLLNSKGPVFPEPKKKIKLAGFFSLKETDKTHYISIAPAIGFNFYDKLMAGVFIHNYNLPRSRFEFLVTPMYATGSKQLNGLGSIAYNFYPGNRGQRLKIGVAAAHFTGDHFIDSTGKKNFQPFSKIVPTAKFEFANKNPRSTMNKYIQWKTFLIEETGLLFKRDPVTMEDEITYPKERRYVNQLELVAENSRKLYPYKAIMNTAQGKGFVRTDITVNYFFNYASGGGMNVRLFGGKFFYTGSKTFLTQFETDRYHLNMTGPKGYEDYNYQNYFYGRNEFEGGANQQIMIRDGAFKVRTDLLSNKIGKTDDWLAAINFNGDIPKAVNPFEMLPIKLPVKVFADIGTYADAWDKNSGTPRLLYDAGLQLSLLGNTLNIYVPLIYSKVYADYFKSTITEKRFWRTLSFSIDIQNISLRKLIPQSPF